MSKLKAWQLRIMGVSAAAALLLSACGSVDDLPRYEYIGTETLYAPAKVSTKPVTTASETETSVSETLTETDTETVTAVPTQTAPPDDTSVTVSGTETSATSQITDTATSTKATTTKRTTTTTTTTTKTTTKTVTTKKQPPPPPEIDPAVFTKIAKMLTESAKMGDIMKKPSKTRTDLFEDRRFTAEKFPKSVYSNKTLGSALDKLDDICAEYGSSISFAYLNTDTGAAVYYRPDVYYGSCSTIKAVYCEALLETKPDLDEKLTVTELWGGDDGLLARYGTGRKYTVRELIRYAIMRSDNTAYLTLVNRFGQKLYNDQTAGLGLSNTLPDGFIFNTCTARQLLKQYEHIYEAGEEKKLIGWLTRLMQKTDLESQITQQLEEEYAVSHKYGSDRLQNCYHDCAICYADSPYVLIILTYQQPETAESDKVFRRLAKQFDIVNEQLIS